MQERNVRIEGIQMPLLTRLIMNYLSAGTMPVQVTDCLSKTMPL